MAGRQGRAPRSRRPGALGTQCADTLAGSGRAARRRDRWGWTAPVLVDEAGEIIAGHGRVLAAARLGLAAVPVITATGWSEAEKRAYRIADNKLPLNAGWDFELLRLELADLRTLDFDVSLTAFAAVELDQLFAPDLDPHAEWQGMPEFDQENKMPFRTIRIHFRDQAAVDDFARLLGRTFTDKTLYAWYPPATPDEKSLV